MKIALPLDIDSVGTLTSGTHVELSGSVYVARDAAHKRMIEALDRGDPLPFDITGETIYYMGPSPAAPHRNIGAAGPTTAGRMDAYTPRLIELGLRAMLGKGSRSESVIRAMRGRAVYFATIGGAGALISRCIQSSETVAYADLGPEAILRIEIDSLPAIVAIDAFGTSIY